MKRCLHLSLVCLLALISGCTHLRNTVIAPTVGPPPLARPSQSSEGHLAVYSAPDYGIPGASDYRTAYRSGYRLHKSDGTPLKYIPNRASTFSEAPQLVPLAPGIYKVTARASAFGMVTVTVLIEAGKTTSVHLDGSELSGSSPSGSEFVTLPDGLVIGWRAEDEAEER